MTSPREAWLEERVKFLESKLRAVGTNLSSYSFFEPPRVLTVDEFRADIRLTEMCSVRMFKQQENYHVQLRVMNAPPKKQLVGLQYMVDDVLLQSMSAPQRLDVLAHQHEKVTTEFARTFWGSPYATT